MGIMIPPIAQQMLVALSTHLAALSAGGMLAYPGVLLQQLKANDTIIQLDLDKGSWIGSVHGLAGMPSLLMPFIMQYRGRKFAFILSCLLISIGWVFTYVAQSITTLIIGECFHGLGGHSLVTISLLSISEMVQPKYRQVCLVLYATYQAFGITVVGILGRYLHWRTAGIIMSSPLVVALILACLWPESPSWLAFKGRFEDCERIFKYLRGTDVEALKELSAIVNHHTERLSKKSNSESWVTVFRNKLRSRDFYIPCLHTLVLVSVFYWTGGVAIIIYSNDIIITTFGSVNENLKLILNVILFIGYVITSILTRYCSNKKVLLTSMFGASFFMISSALVLYLKTLDVITKESKLAAYFVVGYMFLLSCGSCCLGINLPTELMPVKHKGIGGSWFLLCVCIFHSSALKSFPYLCVYINMYGAFLVYGIYGILAGLFILFCVPETRNRTLQELEDYYNLGYFKKDVTVNEFDPANESFLEKESNKIVTEFIPVPYRHC